MARMRVFMVFVLAITAGGALAFGTYNYMQRLPAKSTSIPTRPVVVAAADLAPYEWVMQPPGSLLRTTLEEALTARGAPLPDCRLSTASLIVTLALVSRSDAIAPVSVVQPIQRTSLIFRLFFSWMLNREHEVFGGRDGGVERPVFRRLEVLGLELHHHARRSVDEQRDAAAGVRRLFARERGVRIRERDGERREGIFGKRHAGIHG